MDDSKPLVSICVISYNSADFVLETLESAKAQIYKNIELIVSDDGSSDNTVELCRNWLSENKERFVRTELITVEKNTGIPANCNRGVKAANGKWIKIIAADDILLDNCIQDNVKHVNSNQKIEIQFSIIRLFQSDGGSREIIETWGETKDFFDFDAIEQYKKLLFFLLPNVPSAFILKRLFKDLNYFDEEFPLMEDYPFWLKCTKAGHKLWFMNKLTVLYRRHDNNLTSGQGRHIGLIDFAWNRYEKVREKYVYPNFISIYKWNKQYLHRVENVFKNKKVNRTNARLLHLFLRYLNPYYYLLWVIKKKNGDEKYWMLKKSIRNLN